MHEGGRGRGTSEEVGLVLLPPVPAHGLSEFSPRWQAPWGMCWPFSLLAEGLAKNGVAIHVCPVNKEQNEFLRMPSAIIWGPSKEHVPHPPVCVRVASHPAVRSRR